MAQPKAKYPASADFESFREPTARDRSPSAGEAPEVVEPQTIVHFDPMRRVYTVSKSELNQLESEPGSTWRSLFLASASLCLATGLNAIPDLTSQPFAVTPALFLNGLFGIVSFFSSIAFGIAWRSTARTRSALFKFIREKEGLFLRRRALHRPGAQPKQTGSSPEQPLLPLEQ